MFDEQVGWAVDAGVDFIIGETFSYGEEALIALEVIKEAGQVAVITLAMHQADGHARRLDGGRRLQAAGRRRRRRGRPQLHPRSRHDDAAARSRSARRSRCRSPRCPVPYRTTESQPSFQSLRDTHWHDETGSRPFPIALDPFTCNRFEIAEFGREAAAMGIRYLGVCCGAGPHHIRALAEAVGKRPPGEPLLAGHVQARVPGLARADQEGAEGLRGQTLNGETALTLAPRAVDVVTGAAADSAAQRGCAWQGAGRLRHRADRPGEVRRADAVLTGSRAGARMTRGASAAARSSLGLCP